MSTAIVCLGNEIVGDDGIGIRVGRVLGRLQWPADVRVVIKPNIGLDLVDMLQEFDQIVLVDAMTSGQPPGTCTLLELEAAERMANCPSCSHSIGIPEILQVARCLFPDRPTSSIRIVGVEAHSIDTFGVGLSPAVRDALPGAVQAVLASVQAPADLRERARELAREEASAQPTLAEVLGPR